MHVVASSDIRDDSADVFTVLNNGIPWFEIFERDLMTQRNGFSRRHLELVLTIQVGADNRLSCLNILNCNSHVVVSVMNQELSHLPSRRFIE
jgi:hypothetical protein